jgi:hypothetical protein
MSPIHNEYFLKNDVWKVRYIFYKYRETYPHYLLLRPGTNPRTAYMKMHGMKEEEFVREITHMDVVPDLFIEAQDAYNVSCEFIEGLGFDTPDIIETLFDENRIMTEAEFYAKLNLLLDNIKL